MFSPALIDDATNLILMEKLLISSWMHYKLNSPKFRYTYIFK